MVDLLNTQNPTILPGQRLLSVKGGYEAAEKYPTPRDCEVAIFDEDEDYVYIKRTDTNGGVTITRYSLIEDPIPRFDPKRYVTVDDFASFKEEILNGIKNLQGTIQPNNGYNNKSNNSGKQYSKSNNGVSESGGDVQ